MGRRHDKGIRKQLNMRMRAIYVGVHLAYTTMTRREVESWNSQIIGRFEKQIVGKATSIEKLNPDHKRTINMYASAFETEVRDIFRELHFCSGVFGAELKPVADEAEKNLGAVMDKLALALDEFSKDRDIKKFDSAAYGLLKEGAMAVFDAKAETAKYRVASKEVEPESVQNYVAQILEEKGR